MKILNSFAELNHIQDKLFLTIGNFDGVHLGHKRLIDHLQEKASQYGGKTVVCTFTPHPMHFFQIKQQNYYLATDEDKKRELESLGVDYLLLLAFDETIANCNPEFFLDDIFKSCQNLKYMLVGEDFRFGRNGIADANFLKSYAAQRKCLAEIFPSICHGQTKISSTLIRQAIEKGNMQKAHLLLGHPYSLRGTVVHGEKIGRILSYPTANIELEPSLLLPKAGVYGVWAEIGQERFLGITNVGYRPTVGNQKKITVETYLLDTEAFIYDCQMKIFFQRRIRDEKKFPSLKELKKQISIDIEKWEKMA